ncbi:transglycosylase SLT domain-containing protein [Roseitranquillus sediminis]|uniref:transglycosylase SLT domain-containing protein n=1 Tax=Roseitranquillus sediminis TaxID=2809051 RepID=UPI001D0C3241|nr:transglycosylase SLT domain-containing protein [Roseitranquillus sediminis]MBM9596131.1 transglycosylase SLT domain-containing protein [Roseitranquillus sediminis]
MAVVAPTASAAPVAPDAVCRDAATQASAESGVPLDVLLAISLTETGRASDGATRTWPWTVNSEGKGFWFDTHAEALAFAEGEAAGGTTSFDVGCFQINYRWHGENFASIAEMFEPVANARYAARFLTDLYQELGDWSLAAGAYHSRTPQYASRYRERFDSFRSRLANGDIAPPAMGERYASAEPLVRENNFPLLMSSSGTRSMNSLVPLGSAGARQPFLSSTGVGALR